MRVVSLLVLASALAACAGAAGGTRVPLHVVEEHDDAVLVLRRARRDGVLSGYALLVHVDAHADLGAPELPGSIRRGEDEDEAAYERRLETVLASLAVDDVLVPATLLGLVREAVWVIPDWLDERVRDEALEVGSVGGHGRRLVVAPRLDAVIHPDRRPLRLRVRRVHALEMPEAPWVLGIDLDALACRDPHASHLDRAATEEEARRMLTSGPTLERGRAEAGSVVTESTLIAVPGEAWPRRVDRVEDRETGVVRWVVGWRCLGKAHGLPAHAPVPGEVEAALRRLVARLADAPPPALVVISRSAGSGFVPSGEVDDLERAAVRALREAWPVRAR